MTTEFTLQSDGLDTPELKAPAQKPDKHRATVTGLKLEKFVNKEKGTTSHALNIGLRSTDRNFDTKYMLFIPNGFAEAPTVNPNSLPEEEGNKQQTQYSIAVSNSKKTAELQKLRQYA